jgi:hypothetical protein
MAVVISDLREHLQVRPLNKFASTDMVNEYKFKLFLQEINTSFLKGACLKIKMIVLGSTRR